MIGSNLKKVRSTSTTNEIHFYDGGNLKIDSFEDFPRLINLHILAILPYKLTVE